MDEASHCPTKPYPVQRQCRLGRKVQHLDRVTHRWKFAQIRKFLSRNHVFLVTVAIKFEKVPGFDYKTGQVFHVGLFQKGDFVNITGTSKGKGFSGVIKRHNFSRQKKTHGTGHTMRAPGSIGQASDPSRVFPGMRMAGHQGNARVTVENLQIIKVNRDNNQLLVKGAVPGARNGLLYIRKS